MKKIVSLATIGLVMAGPAFAGMAVEESGNGEIIVLAMFLALFAALLGSGTGGTMSTKNAEETIEGLEELEELK